MVLHDHEYLVLLIYEYSNIRYSLIHIFMAPVINIRIFIIRIFEVHDIDYF